jgi:aspartokinase/homoserine dehydrogenase 1
LIANYINAEELQNFTHVDGILNQSSADACKKLNLYLIMEANEMANFGANIFA